MPSVTAVRVQLAAQATVTAAFALRGDVSGWTFATLLVAAGAVFVAAALQQTPAWRWYAVAFEAGCVLLGLCALVSAHFVPGTLVSAAVLAWLTGGTAARAFAGTPTSDVRPVIPAQAEPVEPYPAPVQAAPVEAPPVPVQAAPIAPRRATVDVLPRR